MEEIMYLRGTSSRSISASASERSLLLGALATHMGVLDTRENDSQTVMRKSELWDEITRHFNAHTTTPRSRQQIQTLYKNMKAKARRYEARLIEVASGIPPPDSDPISEMLLGLLYQQLRHQERHLRTLVAMDTNNLQMEQELSATGIQASSPYFNPEQMMQVSLSEGASDDLDIKSEIDEDDIPDGDDPVGEATLPHPFPEITTTTSKSSPPFSQSPVPEVWATSPSICAPPAPGSSFAQPTSQDNISLHSAAEQKDTSEESSSLAQLKSSKPPHVLSVLPFSRSDIETHTSTTQSIPTTLTNHSNPLKALKYIVSNDELSRETMEHQHPRKVLFNTSTLKRQRMANAPKSCRNSSPRNTGCCCPEIHSKLLDMAKEEHYLKMALLKREDELMTQEHNIKMRILALNEEEARLKVKRTLEQGEHLEENDRSIMK